MQFVQDSMKNVRRTEKKLMQNVSSGIRFPYQSRSWDTVWDPMVCTPDQRENCIFSHIL